MAHGGSEEQFFMPFATALLVGRIITDNLGFCLNKTSERDTTGGSDASKVSKFNNGASNQQN